MLGLPVSPPLDRPLRVLALGAHADDIEIGCGGTISRLVTELPAVELYWAVASGEGDRRREAEASAADLAAGAASLDLAVGAFRDGYLPYTAAEVKGWVRDLAGRIEPDLVLTHHRADLHQDHRLLAELALNEFRDHLILGFEVLKYDGDLGAPNVFVHLDEPTCTRKLEVLDRHFGSQRDKRWFDEEAFRSLMRLRGVECRSPSGYAEAFYCTKLVVGPGTR